jgi:AAA domain
MHPRSSRPCPTPAPPLAALPPLCWLADLRAAASVDGVWLWHGYLAPGNVTLLTSQWKSGKTTLVSVLLSRLRTGGGLAGLPLAKTKAVVVTEEAPAHWLRRSEKLDFGDHVAWLCRPFRTKPTPEEWQALLRHLGEEALRQGVGLVVIDPLAAFLPGRDESHAGLMLEALMPLQELTGRGLAVLVLHHPSKGEPPEGQAARGSGALSSYVDILVEMRGLTRAGEGDRRRRLQAWSRHEETPRQRIIELNADGTDYVVLGDAQQAEFADSWLRLREVLEDATDKLTRAEIQGAWPEGQVRPDEATLWRWLERALAEGLVCREGKGHRNSPFRYWLPAKLAEWERDGLVLPPLPDEELVLAARRAIERRLRQKGQGGA